MLKNAGAKKRRWNPDGLQRGNLRKLNNRLRRGDKHRRVALLIFAGGDQRDRAFVARADRLVNALVKLRRGGEYQREAKSTEESGDHNRAQRDRVAAVETQLHGQASLLPVDELRKAELWTRFLEGRD